MSLTSFATAIKTFGGTTGATSSQSDLDLLNDTIKGYNAQLGELSDSKKKLDGVVKRYNTDCDCLLFTTDESNKYDDEERIRILLQIPVVTSSSFSRKYEYTKEPVGLANYTLPVTTFMATEPLKIRLQGVISEIQKVETANPTISVVDKCTYLQNIKQNTLTKTISDKTCALIKSQAKKSMNIMVNNAIMPVEQAYNKYICKAQTAVLKSANSVYEATNKVGVIGVGASLSGGYTTFTNGTIDAARSEAENEMKNLLRQNRVELDNKIQQIGLKQRERDNLEVKLGIAKKKQSVEATKMIEELETTQKNGLSNCQVFIKIIDNLASLGNLFTVCFKGLVYEQMVITSLRFDSDTLHPNAVNVDMELEQIRIVFQTNESFSKNVLNLEQYRAGKKEASVGKNVIKEATG